MTRNESIQAELADAAYDGMTDAQALARMNSDAPSVARTSIPGEELLDATDEAEYSALPSGQRIEWLSLCGVETIFKDAVPIIKSLFPSGSVTWGNVVKTETKTYAAWRGLSDVQLAEITFARTGAY